MDAPAQRIHHRFGLLVYLFEHKVLIFALCGGEGVIGYGQGRLGDGGSVDALVFRIPLGNRYHFAGGEVRHAAGVRQQRRYIAGEQHFAIAVAHDDAARIAHFEGDEFVPFFGGQRHHCVCAAYSACGGANRILKRAAFVHIAFYQMRNALRVGIGVEGVSLRRKFALQLAVVLDNAVVRHQRFIGAGGMRMRVEIGRLAVRRPARMPQAAAALRHVVADNSSEAGELAGGLVHARRSSVV